MRLNQRATDRNEVVSEVQGSYSDLLAEHVPHERSLREEQYE
ncbi:hypothetical protein [Halogeometricum borinquense]|nr:hypothetical protein [Halogeometricum borinquense]